MSTGPYSNKTTYQHRDILYTGQQTKLKKIVSEPDSENLDYILCTKQMYTPNNGRGIGDNGYDTDTSNYVKQVSASYFLTEDNVVDDMWNPSASRNPYVTKPEAITKYISSSIWNNVSATSGYVPTINAVSSLISDSVWSFSQATSGYVPTINAVQNLRTSNTNTARYNGAIPSSWYGDHTHFVTLDDISFLFGN